MATVILYDINESAVADWARKNCSSFVAWLVYENDELTFFADDPEWCTRYEFDITDEQEAMMFQLKWQGQ